MSRAQRRRRDEKEQATARRSRERAWITRSEFDPTAFSSTLAVSREPRLLALPSSPARGRGSSAGAPCSTARPCRGPPSSC